MQTQKLDQFKLPPNFRGRPGWYVQLWWLVEALLFHTSPQFMYGWRRTLLRLFGARVGKKVLLRSSVHTQFPWNVSIGDYSWIGDGVVLYSLGKIFIGKHVVISQKSYLCAGSHNYQKSDFPITKPAITVEDECWIATDVFIGPGLSIGKATVVGARSSVFTSLPSGKICIGSPAVCVKNRNDIIYDESTVKPVL